jgi:hypothetical protein
MEGRGGLRLRLRGGRDVLWALGVALACVAGGLALMAWGGGRLATALIAAVVKVMFWGFGFGWLGRVQL